MSAAAPRPSGLTVALLEGASFALATTIYDPITFEIIAMTAPTYAEFIPEYTAPSGTPAAFDMD